MRTGWRGSLQFQFEPSTLFFSLLTFVMLSLVTSYSKGLSVHLYRWQRLQRREIFVRSTVGGIMGITQSNEINLSHLQGTNSQISPYWIEQLKRLEKANAKALIAQLVADNPLGFESSAGAAANGGRSSSSPRSGTLLDYTIEQKKKHPNKIILIRSGEFYETYGIDALMLIAYAGLNPMGNKCKAGCPVRNVQATLDGLTSAGLSVAVYEEIAEIDLGRGGNGGVAGGKGAGGSKAKIKSRALTQIVSPASSTYIYDLCLRADDIEYRENRPAVGILSTASGFTLCQVYLDEHCMVVYERLTEEAVRSLISNSGAIDPLFLQDAADLSFLSNHHAIEKIHGHSEHTFPGEVLRKIGDLLDVRTKGFQIFHQAKYSANRPRPVYTSTALQVGLLPNDNVPNLIPHLLPKVSNAFAARFLRKWILNPPPHEIADEMQSLCTSLSQLTYSLPPFQPISIGKLVSLLSAKQCNVYLFRDVQKNAQSLQYILSHAEDYGRILPAMLTLTSFECGLPAESQYLLQATERVGQLIGSVIASEYEEDQPFQDPNKRIPDEFFRRNEEEWRGKVSLSNVQAKVIYDEVDQAASRLCEVLAREYPENCEIVHDMMENALMIKDMPIPRKTEESLSSSSEPNSEVAVTKPKGRNGRAGSKSGPCFAVPGVRYIPYIDRKGKLAAKRYTTEAVSEALNDYLTLAELAPRRIALILQELSENLKEDMISIVQSAHFAVILQTALSHTISAVQKGWAMPTLVDFPHQSTRSVKTRQGLGPSMAIKGLTPYWMPRTNAVSNDVDLRGIFLLTAPNMSGKSTLMRSVLIAALLANCGLYVPATEAKVPRFDTFFLRTASYDVPSEEKSAFALEMDDMRVVLRDCSDKSLVMIDELGKGTSARDGSALAGALLEHLDHKAVYGIFATHLHELFLLPLHLQHIQYKRMGYTTIEQEESSKDPVKVQWSYRLEDGQCLDSMALITARKYHIDEKIIARAQTLLGAFDQFCRPPENKANGALNSHSRIAIDSEEAAGAVETVSPGDLEDQPVLPTESLDSAKETRYDLHREVCPVVQDIVDGLIRPEGSNAQVGERHFVYIPVDHLVPVTLEGSSCLYILHLFPLQSQKEGSVLYVGETESLSQRLHQHRLNYRRKGMQLEVLAVRMPDKSTARMVETETIRGLKKAGFRFDRTSDSQHVLFGQAAAKSSSSSSSK